MKELGLLEMTEGILDKLGFFSKKNSNKRRSVNHFFKEALGFFLGSLIGGARNERSPY